MLVKYIMETVRNHTYDQQGRFIQAVTHFLTRASSIGVRGYLKYTRSEAEYLIGHSWAKDAICGFLSSIGKGFGRTQRFKTSPSDEPFEKRVALSVPKLEEFLYWIQSSKDYSSNTLTTYCFGIKKFFAYCEEFNNDNCRRFISTLYTEGMKPQTIRLRITALERYGEFLGKPVNLKRPKYTRSLNTENILSEKEFEHLCDHLEKTNPADYFLVRAMGTTGCRVSELAQMTFEQIYSGYCTIKGKGDKYRQFIFPKSLRDWAKGKQGPIMITRKGNIMTSRGLAWRLRRDSEECGIDASKTHPHAFRHFFAKMYLKKTKDLVQLAEILGHSNLDTTRIYLQRSLNETIKDINKTVTW